MGRNPDLEKKLQIEKTARKLFRQKGFAGTSYQQIAEEMGMEKTNVQRHFPRKELFVEHFFQDLLDAIARYYKEKDLAEKEYLCNLYQIGTIYFSFLLSPDMQKFTTDVLSDRRLTEVMIQKDMQWAAAYLTAFSLKEPADFRGDVALVMGGTYELLYQHLTGNITTDPQALMAQAILLFAYTLQAPAPDLTELFVSQSFIDEAVAYLEKQLNS
jgi:AcrR family transcriptional regulator